MGFEDGVGIRHPRLLPTHEIDQSRAALLLAGRPRRAASTPAPRPCCRDTRPLSVRRSRGRDPPAAAFAIRLRRVLDFDDPYEEGAHERANARLRRLDGAEVVDAVVRSHALEHRRETQDRARGAEAPCPSDKDAPVRVFTGAGKRISASEDHAARREVAFVELEPPRALEPGNSFAVGKADSDRTRAVERVLGLAQVECKRNRALGLVKALKDRLEQRRVPEVGVTTADHAEIVLRQEGQVDAMLGPDERLGLRGPAPIAPA